LQRRFLTVNILFRSGDIRNRSAKSTKSRQKNVFFGPKFFCGEEPQILDLVYKIAPISDHVTKFRSDWPINCGDLVLKKKKEKGKERNSSKT